MFSIEANAKTILIDIVAEAEEAVSILPASIGDGRHREEKYSNRWVNNIISSTLLSLP
jgi:hypothetical protein